jgi:hypothetical protein
MNHSSVNDNDECDTALFDCEHRRNGSRGEPCNAQTFVASYCGACHYTWQVTAGEALANKPAPRPKRPDKE